VMSEAFAVHQQLLENADADVEHAVAEASARARQGAPNWGAPDLQVASLPRPAGPNRGGSQLWTPPVFAAPSTHKDGAVGGGFQLWSRPHPKHFSASYAGRACWKSRG
jgi:hypothetical protein